MGKRDIYNAVKKATVSIVMELPNRLPKRPFTIIGTGFCVHPEGIVITCEHVFRAFFDQDAYKKLMETIGDGQPPQPLDPKHVAPPQVMFYGGTQGTEVMMYPVGISDAVTKTDFDLAVFKLQKHSAFRNGYPVIPIADYGEIHEMMEIATCGFPLGDSLHDQIGTVTSSFTQGRISSIIPVAGAAVEHLRGFQLDLTATNGNSGGPVFSLETGKVFGVLQAGIMHPATNAVVQGLTKAEPVYPALDHDLVDRLLKGTHRPPGW
jgi:S1-C subfamily serine protease